MQKTITGFFIMLLFAGSVSKKPCLCGPDEENVFSFRTVKSKKVLSVCAEMDAQYLVYRYGLPGKIELTFPSALNTTSWQQFTYAGYYRGGGPMNLGMSDQSLRFSNKGVAYQVYEQSAYADTTQESYHFEAGILIQANGKEYDLKADPQSITGSLQNLSHYEEIENQYGH